MAKIRMFMALPSTGERSDAQCYQLRRLEEQWKDKIEFVYPKNMVSRIFHDYARNGFVESFLESECDVMWFLDSDIVPHPDVLSLFDNYDNWKMAGCPYPVFMTPTGYERPQVVMTVYKKYNGKMASCAVPLEGKEYVDGIATGCIFLKKEVFKELNKPYFEFKYNSETRMMIEGEDLGFCKKVSDLGYKFYIDYKLVCRHIKKVDLLDVNDYAIEFANRSVMNYDKQLRSVVAKKKLGVF